MARGPGPRHLARLGREGPQRRGPGGAGGGQGFRVFFENVAQWHGSALEVGIEGASPKP